MRTILCIALFTAALSFTIATPAAACGDYGAPLVERTTTVEPGPRHIEGSVHRSQRTASGAWIVFVSYPLYDGVFSSRYGDFVELAPDDRTMRLIRKLEDPAAAGVTVRLVRVGKTDVFRVAATRTPVSRGWKRA